MEHSTWVWNILYCHFMIYKSTDQLENCHLFVKYISFHEMGATSSQNKISCNLALGLLNTPDICWPTCMKGETIMQTFKTMFTSYRKPQPVMIMWLVLVLTFKVIFCMLSTAAGRFLQSYLPQCYMAKNFYYSMHKCCRYIYKTTLYHSFHANKNIKMEII